MKQSYDFNDYENGSKSMAVTIMKMKMDQHLFMIITMMLADIKNGRRKIK